MDTVQIEVWVLIDANGKYVVGREQDDLKGAYEEHVGDLDTLAQRLVRVTLTVPKPRAVEVAATIAEEPAAAGVTVS